MKAFCLKGSFHLKASLQLRKGKESPHFILQPCRLITLTLAQQFSLIISFVLLRTFTARVKMPEANLLTGKWSQSFAY